MKGVEAMEDELFKIANQVTATGTAGGGAFTAASGYSMSEVGIFVGIGLTVIFGSLNLFINYYFKLKHYQLACNGEKASSK